MEIILPVIERSELEHFMEGFQSALSLLRQMHYT
jgi:hypothetical protein